MAEIQLSDAIKSFDKSYFSKKPFKEDFDSFYENLKRYAEKIDQAISEDKIEENFKLDFARLLEDSFFYKNNEYAVEPEDKIDMTVKKNGTVKVLMEFKRPKNVSEMIKRGDLNRKALHEALAYFYTEKNLKNNYEIRSVIISNGKEFFIFDPVSFMQKPLEKVGNAIANGDLFSDKTDYSYQLFKQTIQKENLSFDYSYFSLDEIDKCSKSRLVAIYKTLHPDFLLREYSHRDSNQLNSKFYTELLHILGLKEIKKDGKILIEASSTGGLINETIEQLATDKGIYSQRKAFEIAFELSITWMNRLLFLKLFEAQLVSFNGNDPNYKFLTSDNIKNYDDLNNLFFKVLGRPLSERSNLKFEKIPYLNSSLFEVSEIEKKYFSISSLDNGAKTELFKASNLNKWDEYKGKTSEKTLKYFLDFLESYSFASVDDGELFSRNSSDIINSAVLGLIFEKLNGYKEGAFFTPGYITEYIAEHSIERAVISKFNSELNINVSNIEELINYIGSPIYRSDDLKRYNDIVNSLRIIDPAVGSGHFLVSALNYLIFIKSKLGILWDGKTRISEEIQIVDDTLCVYTGDTLFAYKRSKKETYRLQKALFKEKQTIIENCLFGVDINEKSVTICQLRLWVELLKNSFYLDSSSNEMELLPNIDINIKSGNSLISKYKPNIGRGITKYGEGKKVKDLIDRYKIAVANYKHSGIKRDKQTIRENIEQIKANIYTWGQLDLFKVTDSQAFVADKAFEWQVEFPEVLDSDGKFLGFDLVIGNPPYIKEGDNKDLFAPLKSNEYYQGKMDIWYLFVSRGLDLLKKDGYLSFIAPNNWITSFGAKKLRNDILTRATLLNYVDFKQFMVFDSASIQTMIFLLQKKHTEQQCFEYAVINKEKPTRQQVIQFLTKSNLECFDSYKVSFARNDVTNKTFAMVDNRISSLLNELNIGASYLNKDEVIQGIVPNPDVVNSRNFKLISKTESIHVGDGVFVIEKDKFVNLANQEKRYIHPLYEPTDVKKYYLGKNHKEIIYITKKNYQNDAPSLLEHLYKYREIMNQRRENQNGRLEYYHLHWPRECQFFQGKKILSVRKCVRPTFCLAEGDIMVLMAFNVIKTSRFDINFLLGLLNSELIEFWFKTKGKKQGDNYQIDTEPLLEVPIKQNPALTAEISSLVSIINSKKSISADQDISLEEEKINELIYKIYGINDDDIALIKTRLGE